MSWQHTHTIEVQPICADCGWPLSTVFKPAPKRVHGVWEVQCEPCQKCAAQRAEAQPAQATNSAMPKPHRSVCSHCYGSAEMCGSCDNGSRFYPLCREQGVASA